MAKNILKNWTEQPSIFKFHRAIWKAGETPSGNVPDVAPKAPEPVKANVDKRAPAPGNVFELFNTFKTGERVPASSIRISAPYFKPVDEYEKNEKGEILSPWSGKPMSAYALACAREADEKYPAIYKMKHDVPPDVMPAKLELPAGKELFVFGGAHNGKGVADRLASQYKDAKLNFYAGQTLDDMLAQAKGLASLPKDKLDGSTAAIMVDPEVFFGDKDAKIMGDTLAELCKTLKDYGMKVTVSTAPPIGNFYDGEGGVGSKEKQMDGWKKTEAARDKRTFYNEAIRKLFLGHAGVDKVLETDMAFQDYQDSARIHPDYIQKGGNPSYLSAEAFDLAGRIWASGINVVNGVPVPAPKGAPRKQVGSPTESIEVSGNIPAKKPIIKSENFSGKDRLLGLIQALEAMDNGIFPDKAAEFKNKALFDLDWAASQGIDVKQIEELKKNLAAEMPKLLMKIAEQAVDELKKYMGKPTKEMFSTTIAAIDEADKAFKALPATDLAAKEKIIALKKTVTEMVEKSRD